MDLERTLPFRGDGAAAIDHATRALATLGFRITATGATRVEAQGPGLRSTRQELLRGASAVVLEARGGSLALRAELKPLQRLMMIARWLPVAVISVNAFLLTTIMLMTRPTLEPAAWVAGVSLGLIATESVAMMFVTRRMRRRCEQAFDIFLANAAAIAATPRAS